MSTAFRDYSRSDLCSFVVCLRLCAYADRMRPIGFTQDAVIGCLSQRETLLVASSYSSDSLHTSVQELGVFHVQYSFDPKYSKIIKLENIITIYNDCFLFNF